MGAGDALGTTGCGDDVGPSGGSMGVAVSLSVHQLLHFFSATRATTATTISTILDDCMQEFPIA
jgi:hypothetical protein